MPLKAKTQEEMAKIGVAIRRPPLQTVTVCQMLRECLRRDHPQDVKVRGIFS